MESYARRVTQNFGARAVCRYVDVSDQASVKDLPKAKSVVDEPGRLPVSLVDGEVIVAGVFLPTRLDYEVKRVLASRWGSSGSEGARGREAR